MTDPDTEGSITHSRYVNDVKPFSVGESGEGARQTRSDERLTESACAWLCLPMHCSAMHFPHSARFSDMARVWLCPPTRFSPIYIPHAFLADMTCAWQRFSASMRFPIMHFPYRTRLCMATAFHVLLHYVPPYHALSSHNKAE